MDFSLIAEHSPIATIPGIGRRTAALLRGAGVHTVGSFTRLPDLLLEYTFGPSLPAIRRRAEELLAQSSKQQFTSLVKRVVRQLLV